MKSTIPIHDAAKHARVVGFRESNPTASYVEALLAVEKQMQAERVATFRKPPAAPDPARTSREIHEAVVSFREKNPDTSYSDALVIVSRERKRKARLAPVGDRPAVDMFSDDDLVTLTQANAAFALMEEFGIGYAEAILHVRDGTRPKRGPSVVPMTRTSRGGRDYFKFHDADADFVCMGEAGAVA